MEFLVESMTIFRTELPILRSTTAETPRRPPQPSWDKKVIWCGYGGRPRHLAGRSVCTALAAGRSSIAFSERCRCTTGCATR